MITQAPFPTEREVQKSVVAIYAAVGCFVGNLAQGYRPGGRRHGTTRQTKGIPDLYVFPPLRAGRFQTSLRSNQPFWHEVKRPGATQTPEQKRWQEECKARGIAYVLGGVDEALAHLRAIGLVAA